MKNSTGFPVTNLNHRHQEQLKGLLQEPFARPDLGNIAAKIVAFLRHHPPSLSEFPKSDGTYSRTIVHRDDNGFEVMVARWSKGAISSIHGHPPFIFYYVIKGSLEIDNYRRDGAGVVFEASELVGENEHFFSIGRPGKYDNNIHQVQANEETLSLHISSDDSTKGEVFSRITD